MLLKLWSLPKRSAKNNLILPMPKFIRNAKTIVMRRRNGHAFDGNYEKDLALRGSVRLYQGMAVNFFYAFFRLAVGIRYTSVWFVSMAVYYLVLGMLRLMLIFGYRRRSRTNGTAVLPPNGVAAVPAEYPHGRHDRADGVGEFRLFFTLVMLFICRPCTPFTPWRCPL